MKEIKKEERNELDDQGNPYPVLYMRLKSNLGKWFSLDRRNNVINKYK